MTSPFQALPSVERILSDERVRQLIEAYSRPVVTTLVRSHLDSARKTIAGGGSPPEFDDLVDGVEYLVGTGLVDKKRVGVTGGSYGGYASAWCATYYSEYFAAAVMFVGISDQIAKFGTTDIPNEMYLVHEREWT